MSRFKRWMSEFDEWSEAILVFIGFGGGATLLIIVTLAIVKHY